MKHLFIALLSFGFLAVQAQGIEFFNGTFAEAQAAAKKEGKIIFMDAFAEWCGPCKRMARDVFPTKEAGDFFNENFINVKMDMEKGEGRDLAKIYNVGSYPTLLFLDYAGGVVYQTKGARIDAASLIKTAEQALLPSETSLALLTNKWETGERSTSFLKEYVQTQAVFKNDYNEAFKLYIENVVKEKNNDDSFLSFVLKYTNDANSAGMKIISENKTVLKTLLGTEKFDAKILSIAAASVAATKDLVDLNKAKAMLKSFKPEDYNKQTALLELKFYSAAKDWNAYDKAATKYLSKYEKNNDEAYNKVAWNYYMNIDNVNALAKAEKWMQSAIKLNNTYANNLTQSYLLYKMEKYSLAQDAVEYALILAKNGTNQTVNAEMLKKKIEDALAGNKKEVVVDYDVD